MTEIQKRQSFPASAERCLEGLLRIWPYLDIQTKRSSPVNRTAEGIWRPGSGSQFIFRAECKDSGGNSCEVSLRHDLQWTSAWSRPMVPNEKVAKLLEAKTLEQMDRVFKTLEQFLKDASKFPEGVAVVALDLDTMAWVSGIVVSIALRLLAGWYLSTLARSFQGPAGVSPYLRGAGIAGVLVGAAVAGWVKRRNPAKGSAFFEGLIVALANIWLSLFVYKAAFTMGFVDWIVYGVAGLVAASLASMRFPAKKAG